MHKLQPKLQYGQFAISIEKADKVVSSFIQEMKFSLL
ncbi:hypothetical protein Pint_30353 [Pistacia integerrima]|uniref:Uncharacterized protein n=1 Tax=Pistacia integerrima TaxID=434235 RepID=A0ACC0WZ93_9ROSI|nr:hypothetical protein Pint_30353 [Pistacia integerrima]